MSKRDSRYPTGPRSVVNTTSVKPPIPAPPPALPAQAGRPPPAPAKRVRPTCATCDHKWEDGRCHAHPPVPFGHYDNVSVWPSAPDSGGCAEHKKKDEV